MWWILYTIVALVVLKLYNKWSSGWCYSRKIMTGKVVVVTGANSGIGFETALNLAKRGAKVVLACRDEGRGAAAAKDIRSRTSNMSVLYKNLDLSSFKSIRKFAEELKSSELKLDVLVNNAGITGFQDVETENGLITDVQVNHFGPFLLTVLLVPLLKKSAAARVVTVSSVAHHFGNLNFETINKKRSMLKQYTVYSNTKLFNILFTSELARRLEGSGVTANALNPGVVETGINKNIPFKPVRFLLNVLFSFCKTPLEGAQSSIYLCVSDDVEGVSGKYFVDCRKSSASAAAGDVSLARQLWDHSEEVTGLTQDEMQALTC